MSTSHYINGQWLTGSGQPFTSINPASDEIIWTGNAATKEEVDQAVIAAVGAFNKWRTTSLDVRMQYLEKFKSHINSKQLELAEIISKEVGKPLWEAKTEISAMVNKVGLTIESYRIRCPEVVKAQPQGTSITRHQPHGVMAIFGPFNFPAHLPHGHIIPALLAGNTVVFKPSEIAPAVAQALQQCWNDIGLPTGVLNLIQGKRETGQALAAHPQIDGLLFTGSWPTGLSLSKMLASTPYKILALEMGGNNPYVIGQISDLKIAAYLTLQSAFLTSGQRCTCARRLIIPRGQPGDDFLNTLIEMTRTIKVGAYNEQPEPFMGPVISATAAQAILSKQSNLIAQGAKPLILQQQLPQGKAFLSPGIIDVTAVKERPDEEIFGPLLQVIRTADFEAALHEAADTKFGLAAGLLSDNIDEYQAFYRQIKAGVINWNLPLTGASSAAPFGGLGQSGNNRPSAFYAIDYCAYPVASLESPSMQIPSTILPGVKY